jgi:hypothetical protein
VDALNCRELERIPRIPLPLLVMKPETHEYGRLLRITAINWGVLAHIGHLVAVFDRQEQSEVVSTWERPHHFRLLLTHTA